jgi:hypothetical protein
MLYFGLFNKFDLLLFGSGIGISLLLLAILPVSKLLWAIIALLPGVVTGVLVIPIPNYHNIRTIIKLAYEFYTTRQKFIWKGWCFTDGDEDSKK